MIERPKIALVLLSRLEENIQILRAIAKYKRYHTKWHVFIDDQAKAARNPGWLLMEKWDGIICKKHSETLIEAATAKGIACVDLSDDQVAREGCLKIIPDNRAFGHVGAEHFMDKGYRNYAFCGFGNEHWSRERRDGFVEALQLAGKECSAFESDYPHVNRPAWEADEEEEVSKWLQTLAQPVAIMACNDMRALQVVNACHEVGLSVPEDVAVLGANNEISRCDLSNPSLSSIPVNAGRYGHMAASALDNLLQTGKHGMDSDLVLVDPMPVVSRRSTDALAVDDRSVAAALNLIAENACSGLTVQDVSKKVGMSRSLLEKRFRLYVGRSPQVEIRHAQINRVKQLLLDTDYSLYQIAELTGFQHPEYLSVVFKRLTGINPSVFRKKNNPEYQ